MRRALAGWFSVALLACKSAQAPAQPDAAPPAAEPSPETDASEPQAPEAEAHANGGHEHGVLEHDINARYDEETDVRRWQQRFEARDREVSKKRDAIVAQLGLREGMRVADVGAGTGLFTFAMARAVGPEGKVFAVDVQDYFLEHLAEKARRDKLTNVTTTKATQKSSELAPGSIDLAFLCDAYHHIEHPRPYLASLHAALAPGGKLVIVDFVKDRDASRFIKQHVRATPEEFRAEIEAAGFTFARRWDGLDENFFFVFVRQ